MTKKKNNEGGVTVYIGATIKDKLRSGTVLDGTVDQVREQHANVIREYPEAGQLFVPFDKLAKSVDQVRKKGYALHRNNEALIKRINQPAAQTVKEGGNG